MRATTVDVMSPAFRAGLEANQEIRAMANGTDYDTQAALNRQDMGNWRPRAGSAFAERTTHPEVEAERQRVLADAAKIADMCVAAKQPLRMADFISRGLSAEQVATELAFGTAKPWSEVLQALGIRKHNS